MPEEIYYNKRKIELIWNRTFLYPMYCAFLLNNETLPIYFGAKNKHNYKLMNPESLIEDIQQELYSKYDFFIIPESSSGLLRQIVGKKPHIEFRKNSKAKICEEMLKNKFSKEEMASLESCFAKMENGFQMHYLKANKRIYATKHIFQNSYDFWKIRKTDRIVVLDDAYITGNTLKALDYKLKEKNMRYDRVVLFADTLCKSPNFDLDFI